MKIWRKLSFSFRFVNYTKRWLLGVLDHQPTYYPRGHLLSLGGGRMVAAAPGSSAGTDVMIYLQRKLEPNDLVNGKLVPVAHERVVRHGGKRGVNMQLSYESARALHHLLGKALRDARKLQADRAVEGTFLGLAMSKHSDLFAVEQFKH